MSTRAETRAARRAQAVQPPPKKRNAVATKAPSRAVAVHQPQPPQRQESVLQIIARAASDPKVQPDKMRALLEMQKEIAAEEARRAHTRAFIAMQHDLPVINATGRIEIEPKPGARNTRKQSTPYATFNEINKVTKPILRDHGFAMWFAPDERGPGLSGVIVRGYLEHIGGHSKTCTVPVPLENSGSKNDAQGMGSSIAYGKRYCAIALLNLISEAQEDRDLDGNTPGPVVDAEQHDQIMKALDVVGCRAEILIKRLNEGQPKGTQYPKIETLDQLPAARFQEAMDRLKAFATAKAEREAQGGGSPAPAQ